MKTITMWHGGRNLEYDYKKSLPAKGLWEHGPGLYLTTSYTRAKQYAKGGGTTYNVTVEEGSDIKFIKISIEKIIQFITENVIKNKRNEFLEDVYTNMKRMKSTSHMEAEHFLNLAINLEAIKKSNTAKLCNFLIENGVDYGFTNSYGGSDETVMVVYNREKIKSVKKIISKDVNLTNYTFDCNFVKKIPAP